MGRLRVDLIEARGLIAKDRPLLGRPNSDPYVVFSLNQEKQQSPVIQNNLNPVWNQAYVFNSANNGNVLRLSVYDYDQLTQNDALGHAEVSLNLNRGVPSDLWVNLNTQGQVHIRLTAEDFGNQQQMSYPQQQVPMGYPQQQQVPMGYPQQPMPMGYPQQQQPMGYPQQQPMGYPQQQPMGYPQQQPMGYPQQQVPMGYPQQTMGYPQQQPMGYQQPQQIYVATSGGYPHGHHGKMNKKMRKKMKKMNKKMRKHYH